MVIKWTADLSVKNDGLDKEHQRWIEILNEFYLGLMAGKSKDKLEELVVAMLDYTKYHFSSEEKYMASINYPGLDEHKAIHASYVEKITEFHDKIKNGKLIVSLEVTNFLKTWLINHIKGTDMQYANYKK